MCFVSCTGPSKIKCYSGDKLIYDGSSEGRVYINTNHIRFIDSKTGIRTRVYADCIIEEIESK